MRRLDVLLVHKLGTLGQEELPVDAIASGGLIVLTRSMALDHPCAGALRCSIWKKRKMFSHSDQVMFALG
jgi:predicted phosphoribosyltransferase